MAGPNEPDLDGATVVEQGQDPLVGTVINGKFRIVRAIARGGMGRIYYATQVPFERPVALKVVQADTVNEEESQFLKRFLQEASILAKLQHPNVVMLFDYGRIEPSSIERYFIAMEYLAGETLAHRFKNRGPMSMRDALILMRQILRGLREAHKLGIVHRDLKPSNIILVPDGDGEIVKLVDFGIGKVLQKGEITQDLTQEGVMVGTPRYMAPEQFDGIASTASDLYALGTIIYQALTGHLPFRGNTLAEFMVAKLTHPIPRLREIAPACDAPDSLEGLVFALLARAPHDRPPLDVVFSQLAQIEEEVFGTPHSLRRGSISGSTPSLPPSSPSGVQGKLLVPYTVVGSMPPSMPPSGIMGVTPRPMATTNRPPPAGGRGLAVVVMVLLGMAIVGFGGIAWWAKSRSDAKQAAAASASAPAASASSSAPETKAPFLLTIDSTPPGATVTEDDRPIGETPVQIPIDRASVASGARTFVVKKDGFLASTVQQGASEENVKSVVTLAPDPSPHVKSHAGATKQGGGASTAGKQQQPAQSNTGSLDIRMNR